MSTTIVASGNHGSGTTGPIVDCAALNTLRCTLDVTVDTIPAGQSANNSPLLEVALETSPTGTGNGTDWRRVAQFDHVRGVANQKLTVVGFDRYVRARWRAVCFVTAIDGVDQAPAFTWSLLAEAT